MGDEDKQTSKEGAGSSSPAADLFQLTQANLDGFLATSNNNNNNNVARSIIHNSSSNDDDGEDADANEDANAETNIMDEVGSTTASTLVGTGWEAAIDDIEAAEKAVIQNEEKRKKAKEEEEAEKARAKAKAEEEEAAEFAAAAAAAAEAEEKAKAAAVKAKDPDQPIRSVLSDDSTVMQDAGGGGEPGGAEAETKEDTVASEPQPESATADTAEAEGDKETDKEEGEDESAGDDLKQTSSLSSPPRTRRGPSMNSGSDDTGSMLSADISDFVSHFAATTFVPDDASSMFTSVKEATPNDNLDDILGPITSVAEEGEEDEEDEEERESKAKADALIQMTKAAIDALSTPSKDAEDADNNDGNEDNKDNNQNNAKNDNAEESAAGSDAPHPSATTPKASGSDQLVNLGSQGDESQKQESNNADGAADKPSDVPQQQDDSKATDGDKAEAAAAAAPETGTGTVPSPAPQSAASTSGDNANVDIKSNNNNGDAAEPSVLAQLSAVGTEESASFDPVDRIVLSLNSTLGVSPSSTAHNVESTISPTSVYDSVTMNTSAAEQDSLQSEATQQTNNASPSGHVRGPDPNQHNRDSSPSVANSPSKFTFNSVAQSSSDASSYTSQHVINPGRQERHQQNMHHQHLQKQQDQSGMLQTNSTLSGNEGSAAPGGRLWQTAKAEAQENSSPRRANKFTESLMARTRSRAEPDALLNMSATAEAGKAKSGTPTMIQISEDEDMFIVNTVLARKRVRVVQLLIMGLVAFCVGFMGSFVVQSSCHFVSAEVQVGQESKTFDLHYGLWKYTPMDSVFQGYSYCYPYDDSYTNDAPMISRWCSCAAMLLGTYALCVLWYYLILGRASETAWKYAVGASALAAVLQLSTFQIFAGDVCSRDECTIGPGGIISFAVSVVWIIMAFEMHYNKPTGKIASEYIQDTLMPTSPASVIGSPRSVPTSPVGYVEMDNNLALPTFRSRGDASPSAMDESNVLVAQLELTDFNQASRAFVRRIVPQSVAASVVGDDDDSLPEELPSLNRRALRSSPRKRSEVLMERDLAAGGSDTNYRSFV